MSKKLTIKDIIKEDAKNHKMPNNVSKRIWNKISERMNGDTPEIVPSLSYDGDYPSFSMPQEDIEKLIN